MEIPKAEVSGLHKNEEFLGLNFLPTPYSEKPKFVDVRYKNSWKGNKIPKTYEIEKKSRG